MSNLKQSTLNEHVNLEAIGAFADKLKAQAESIVMTAFLRDHTPAEDAALKALARAEAAMRLAYDLAGDAELASREVWRVSVYQRGGIAYRSYRSGR